MVESVTGSGPSRPDMDRGADGIRAGIQRSGGIEKLPGIRQIIAVGSAKGGVGKSTVSVNLALALIRAGARVGLVDADIHGPSIPGMLGVAAGEKPTLATDGRMMPIERHGLKLMSMGLFSGHDNPVVMRGPMVGKYLSMFIAGVQWGPLDYLMLDLPPGTGDTQLTLAQSFPLSGAVIVTTPQDVSLNIARRGARMFEQLHVPILGIIENMRSFTCPGCGETTDIFRRGGGERLGLELGVPFLGALPLDADVVTCGDEGRPIVADRPDSVSAGIYATIADALIDQLRTNATALQPFRWNWTDDGTAPQWLADAVRPEGARTTPVGVRRRDARTLSILWEDGHADDFDVRELRLACRCAQCVDEMSGRQTLDPKSVPADVSPTEIRSVGSYALGFKWSDGHGSGIHSFAALRALGARIAAERAEHV